MRILKWVGAVLGVIAALMLVLAVGVMVLLEVNANAVKGGMESAAKAVMGRELAIGNLEADVFSVRPLMRLEGISLANAPWSEEKEMMSVDRMHVQVDLAELAKGTIVVPEMIMNKPEILLERNAQGENNWDFIVPLLEKLNIPRELPVVDRLEVTDMALKYRQAESELDLDMMMTRFTGGARPDGMIYEGEGQFMDKPMTMRIKGAPREALFAQTQPYPFDVDFALAKTKMHVQGTLDKPLEVQGVKAVMNMESPDPTESLRDLPLPIPLRKLPPLKMKTEISEQDGTIFFKNLSANLGNSDFAGNMQIKLDERIRLEGDMRSEKIDLRDFDFDLVDIDLGVNPAMDEPPLEVHIKPEGAADSDEEEASEQNKSRLIPDTEIPFGLLSLLDVAFKFQGQEVTIPHFPLKDVRADIALENGTLKVQPADFDAVQGHVWADVTVKAQEQAFDMAVDFKQIRLQQLLKELYKDLQGSGRINGQMRFTSQGDSVVDLLKALDGKMTVEMQGGELDTILSEFMTMDMGKAIMAALTKDEEERTVSFRCMMVDFDVNDGVMKIDNMVMDTTDALLTGEGYVDLSKERLDIQIVPRAKDFSLLAPESPIYVRGSFREIEGGPKVEDTLASLVTPKKGTDEEADCQALAKNARDKGQDEPVIKQQDDEEGEEG